MEGWMNTISLTLMTREICHSLYKNFENDPAIYMDMSKYRTFQYDADWVDKYFDKQMLDDRVVFAIMRDGTPVGEVKLKNIDKIKKECSLGIHLQNDSVKGLGIGTLAEKMALDYAFEKLHMEIVNADVVLKNKRSQHVLEKVGFQYLREDNCFKYYVYKR